MKIILYTCDRCGREVRVPEDINPSTYIHFHRTRFVIGEHKGTGKKVETIITDLCDTCIGAITKALEPIPRDTIAARGPVDPLIQDT